MSITMAWETANATKTRQIASEAARRAGMAVEDWLDEAVVIHAAHEHTQGSESETQGESAPPRLGPAGAGARPAAQDPLEAAVSRIERSVVRNAEETLRALEWLKRPGEPPAANVKPSLSGEPRAERARLGVNDLRSKREEGAAARSAEQPVAIPRAEPRKDRAFPQAEQPPNPLEPSFKPNPNPTSSRFDLRGAVSEIARRRQELDGRAASDLAAGRPSDVPKTRGEAAPPASGAAPEAPGSVRSSERNEYRSLEQGLRSSLKAPQGGLRALARKLDHFARAKAELASSAAGIAIMRAEISEIRRTLADVAPRNAIVALEGAIKDLTQRVEILRQNGHRETLLAPLDAMAAELQATLKAHDPQMVATVLERDIHAIGTKIESLAQSAIKPETLERIRAQTEEVRNLLAAAAMRATPAERLERQIGELADRVERLGASAAPQFEIHQLAAALDSLRKEIELRTPLPALVSIERRLERIGARLDQELARPVQAAFDARPFEDLARRIEGVREAVEARSEPTPDAEQLVASVQALNAKLESSSSESLADWMRGISTKLDAANHKDAGAPLVERRLADIVDRLDRMPQELRAPAVDMRPLVDALRALGVKLDAPPPLDREAAERVADAVARRVQDLAPGWTRAETQGLVDQLAEIHDRLATLAGLSARSDALHPLVERQLAEIVDRLDRMPQALRAPAVDMQPLVEALHALDAKLAATAPPALDREALEQVAKAVARRFQELAPSWGVGDVQGLVDQLAEIHDRLDAIAGPAMRSDALAPLIRELLVRLPETQPAPRELEHTAELASVAAELSEMRLERATADQNTQVRLKGLEQVLDRLFERLAVLEPGARSAEPTLPPQTRDGVGVRLPSTLAGGSAKGPRTAEPDATASGKESSAAASGEEFLIEPGAGAPKRVQEARETAQATGPRTTPALSAHIAAARRAASAQAAPDPGEAEKIAAAIAAVSPHRKGLFAGQKRYLLVAAALVAVVAAAVRLGGPQLLAQHKPAADAGAAKTAAPVPPRGAFDVTGARTDVGAVDTSPTATIEPMSERGKAKATAGSSVPDLPPTIPAGAPQALRDAALAGIPGAEYELAARLFDGHGGLSQDPRASALWFQRAAESGLAPAQFRLAALYQKGVGVARDDGAAKRWYAKAAEAGNARAAHNLAVMDAEPANGAADYVEAAKWFRKAAELGVRDSQFNLAVLYARGLGVEWDLKQSWMWFSLAAAQGDADAAKKRDEVANKMDAAALAAATDALSKFKAAKPDPAANQVDPPPGGWDAPPGSTPPAAPLPSSQTSRAISGGSRLM